MKYGFIQNMLLTWERTSIEVMRMKADFITCIHVQFTTMAPEPVRIALARGQNAAGMRSRRLGHVWFRK
jgi:hypothetical protein